MPVSRRATPENGPRDSVAGVVITERLVATSPGSASGTFEALGAITGTGTVTGAWAWRACRGTTQPHVVEGSQRLVTAGGQLRIDVRLSLRRISGTGVLTGGGSWNLRAADGEFDGIRAAGTLTVSATVEEHGASTMELMLTGCVPASAGPGPSTGWRAA
ncbi:MAG TPA: hypothetical protein VFG75_09660 [Gaiella sp.]|nr:hypothetical protein [Gaiella sp.]